MSKLIDNAMGEKRELLQLIRQYDRNGFETLEGHERILQLREAVMSIFEPVPWHEMPPLVREYHDRGIWTGIATIEGENTAEEIVGVWFGERWNGFPVLWVTDRQLEAVREFCEKHVDGGLDACPDFPEEPGRAFRSKVGGDIPLYSLEGLCPTLVGSLPQSVGEQGANNGRRMLKDCDYEEGSYGFEEWVIGQSLINPLTEDEMHREEALDKPQRIVVMDAWDSIAVVYSLRDAEARFPDCRVEIISDAGASV